MSTNVIFDGGELVLASEDDRIVEGLLLPFNTVGHTNIGAFTVEAGVLKLPADPEVITLNIDHDREQPVGRAVKLEERTEGVYARYRIAKTPEGDQALADIKSGKRKSLSMESKGVLVRAGKAISGFLFGSALVPEPAFVGATVIAALNEDGSVEVDGEEVPAESTTSSSYTTTNSDGSEYNDSTTTTEEVEDLGDGKKRITRTTVAVTEITEPNNQKETAVGNATAPETVAAGAVKSDTTKTLETVLARLDKLENGDEKPKDISPETAFAAMADVLRGTPLSPELHKRVFRDPQELMAEAETVFAAQTNIADPVANVDLSPQWAGEFWGRVIPTPRYLQLANPKTLTKRTVQGYRWTALPSFGDWAGNGAEITSGPVSAAATAVYTALKGGGGNTISREEFDFGEGEALLADYFAKQAVNVDAWLNGKVKTAIVEGSIDGGTTIIAGPNAAAAAAPPTGVDAGINAIIEAVFNFMDAHDGQVPDWVLVDSTIYRTTVKTLVNGALAYLSQALGLTGGELANIAIIPVKTADLTQTKQATGTNGSGTNRTFKAIAGVKAANDLYKLPGSPFQAQAVNVANGLIQVGVYAYGLPVPQASYQNANKSDGVYGVY